MDGETDKEPDVVPTKRVTPTQSIARRAKIRTSGVAPKLPLSRASAVAADWGPLLLPTRCRYTLTPFAEARTAIKRADAFQGGRCPLGIDHTLTIWKDERTNRQDMV